MKPTEKQVNDLIVFNGLLFEATKWFKALEQSPLRHEVKYDFKQALEKMKIYERRLAKIWGVEGLNIQEDIAESFSNLLLQMSKMDTETKNKFSQYISKFFDEK